MDLYDSDSDGIPEVEFSIQIQPYMYEPIPSVQENYHASNSSSESDSEGDIGHVDENLQPPHGLDWCSCGNCVIMPTARECKCCLKTNIVDSKIEDAGIKCITEHEGFIANCLNIHVLETSFYEFIQENGPPDQNQQIHELYRHIAYRRFVRWIWKLLGRKNRRIIPSCAINAIRNTFPSERYCGFKYPQ